MHSFVYSNIEGGEGVYGIPITNFYLIVGMAVAQTRKNHVLNKIFAA